jgi:hypothetical protein
MKWIHRRKLYGLLPLLPGLYLPATAQQLHISPGLHVVAQGAPQLIFQDLGLINNGYFTAASSTVIFTDSFSRQPVFIGGSSVTGFHELYINKRYEDVRLNNNIQVTGSIHLNSGNLQLNRYGLDLGSTGTIIGERNNARITGSEGSQVKRKMVLDAPQGVDPGNIGVSITSNARMGETTIIRGQVSPLYTPGASVADRYFDITPANNTGLDASLQFHYLDAEVKGNENELALFSRHNYGNTWKANGGDNSNTQYNRVVTSHLSQLHRYTLATRKDVAVKKLQVYPNPIRDRFWVTLPACLQKEITITLFNESGQLLEKRKIARQAGGATIEWNMNRYVAGTYHLAFEGASTNTIKLIKE